MSCVVTVRGANETRVQIKVIAHCTTAVTGGALAVTIRQMTGAGTQMKNIVGHCEYSLMTLRRSPLSYYTRNISHTTICAIVICWFGLLFDLLSS